MVFLGEDGLLFASHVTGSVTETNTLIASIRSSRPECLIANSMILRMNISDHVSSNLP